MEKLDGSARGGVYLGSGRRAFHSKYRVVVRLVDDQASQQLDLLRSQVAIFGYTCYGGFHLLLSAKKDGVVGTDGFVASLLIEGPRLREALIDKEANTFSPAQKGFC